MSELIQPVKSGAALLDEIRSTDPGPTSVAVWWLGQSGFVLKGRSATLVIDPYLSEHLTRKYEGTSKPHVRMTAAPFRGGDFVEADLILTSHKHSDHIDPGTLPDLMRASAQADLLYPVALTEHVASLDLPSSRCIGIDAGGIHIRPGLIVRAIPSAHEGLDKDAEGRHLYLGFVIELDGTRFYHSGDSVVYPGLVDELGPERFDVLFLPINGRNPERGVPGNMSAAEAVDLANEVGPRFVVPHHYDMFTFNTVPVATFDAEAKRLRSGVTAKVLRCGERWEVGPWA